MFIFQANKNLNMTEEQFKALLHDHDWYYSSRDDIIKYNKGYAQEKMIQQMCQGNEKFTTLYKEKKSQIFPSKKS